MEIAVPPSIVTALTGGGLIAVATLALLEWLKSRDWFTVTGDALILVSVAMGTLLSFLVWVFGWVTGGSLGEIMGLGVASGIGASALRDALSAVFKPSTVIVIDDDPTREMTDEEIAELLSEGGAADAAD